MKAVDPTKKKYERNKISASIVLAYLQLCEISGLEFYSLLAFTTAVELLDCSVLKYYRKIIYPHRDFIFSKKSIPNWENRKLTDSL